MYIHHEYFSLNSLALTICGIMLIHEFSRNHFQGKWHPVHTLAASGEFYLMTSLLKHGVDINAPDKVHRVTTTICIFLFHIHFACSLYAYKFVYSCHKLMTFLQITLLLLGLNSLSCYYVFFSDRMD